MRLESIIVGVTSGGRQVLVKVLHNNAWRGRYAGCCRYDAAVL